MNTKVSLIVGTFVIAVASISAQAQPAITGEINFSGSDTIDTAIPAATTFESFFGPGGPLTDPVIQAGGTLLSGSYLGLAGNTPVTFASSFDFASPTLPFALWSFTSGGDTYSFQVDTVTTDQQNVYPGGIEFINLGGLGTANITGDAPTLETWSITGTSSSAGSLTLTLESSFVAVPEPSTLAFAGLGSLLSVASLRRRK